MPLFDSVRGVWSRFAVSAAWPALADYQALLEASAVVSGGGARLRVMPQHEATASDWQLRYEARIYRTGELPTRSENWHDFFNVLAWASFPQTKAALNSRHYHLLAAQADAGQPKQRTAAQDALTQFDETGVVVLSSAPDLLDLIREYRWKELFWERREDVRTQMRCLLFGHGLMEKALAPYVGMTGKGMLLSVAPAQTPQQVDAVLASAIAALNAPRDLSPVPLLGFPGMCDANRDEAFFDNRDYFRAPRHTP